MISLKVLFSILLASRFSTRKSPTRVLLDTVSLTILGSRKVLACWERDITILEMRTQLERRSRKKNQIQRKKKIFSLNTLTGSVQRETNFSISPLLPYLWKMHLISCGKENIRWSPWSSSGSSWRHQASTSTPEPRLRKEKLRNLLVRRICRRTLRSASSSQQKKYQ